MTLKDLLEYETEITLVMAMLTLDDDPFHFFVTIIEERGESPYVEERIAWACTNWLWNKKLFAIPQDKSVILALLDRVREELHYAAIEAEGS